MESQLRLPNSAESVDTKSTKTSALRGRSKSFFQGLQFGGSTKES